MTGGVDVNGTRQPVSAFPTEGLMDFIKIINDILAGLVGFLGGGTLGA
jgi:hypothetical protein